MVPFSEAWDRETEEIPLIEAAGRTVGEFINLYPPGVPVLVPGEKITKELLIRIAHWLKHGLTVQGIKIRKEKYLIQVLKEKNGK